MSRLMRLHEDFGQSPWLDNLKRSYLTTGEIDRLIASGIRGITSNPSIFQKSIQGSTDYDEQFFDSIAGGRSVVEAYWDLVVSDIVGALDHFADLYRSSGGGDGFVSVEVDPHLAHDGPGTLRAAEDLWNRISRPNLMVKIPATLEGLPAIRSMIAAGRNVNVTLIFGIDRYRSVMEAYLAGLEDRANNGEPLDRVASVASFFVSRVDSEIDRRLESTGDGTDLAGRAAIAQARIAYAEFRRTFSGPRWERLADLGARVQRPLWASTSTKNPTYPDTLYVDELIGPDSVNTLPDQTMTAFSDHGRLARTVDVDVEASRLLIDELSRYGIDLERVVEKLEVEGIDAFQKSFDELVSTLEAKSRR